MEIERAKVVERLRRTNIEQIYWTIVLVQGWSKHTRITRHTDTSTTTKDNRGLHYHEKDILKYACQAVFPVSLLQLGAWSLWLTHHSLCQTLWAQSFWAPPPMCVCVYVVRLSSAAWKSNLNIFVFQISTYTVFVIKRQLGKLRRLQG